ncbi:MAG TPA: GGDEF domain-containing protein [Noviherbaspirillum sp.]|nr:GGDEF domain-containing protein [Noviherbaspirillum sp.]
MTGSNKPEQNPAEIAREAFRRLAARRIAPTPDAYREIYEEIAGAPSRPGAEKVLAELAASLAATSASAATLSAELARSLERRDWNNCTRQLTELVAEQVRRAEQAAEQRAPAPPNRRAQPFPLVDEAPAPAPGAPERRQDPEWRELLARALGVGIVALLRNAPDLAQEAEKLAAFARDPANGIDTVSSRLKQLCFKIELRADDMAEEHDMLLRLFRLLLENVTELVDDDTWLAGQMKAVQQLLAGPVSHAALADATRNLKEVIYKQGLLKRSLAEAQATVKSMMMTFIDRLGAIAASTGDYHRKIDGYAQKINAAKGIAELNLILSDVMQDTRTAQTEALRSRDEMIAARKDAQEAEGKVQQLEAQLEEMSELAMEDALTGSLNRRGLDDVFERELARAQRRHTPLCIALLDLDDFKRVNDTFGHGAGDGVLVHLVRVIRETLRTMDVIGRFGGEEFLIILPDTALAEAAETIRRLQRELTKRIFMHENAKLLITFSAGVAERIGGEDQTSLIRRADGALYKAKAAGKNRVAVAD